MTNCTSFVLNFVIIRSFTVFVHDHFKYFAVIIKIECGGSFGPDHSSSVHVRSVPQLVREEPEDKPQGGQSNIFPVNTNCHLLLILEKTQYLRSDVHELDVSLDLGQVEILYVKQETSELNSSDIVFHFKLLYLCPLSSNDCLY